MKHVSHIKSLHIYITNKDLSILRGFSNLKELYVKYSDTKDWSYLTSLTSLTSLFLCKCNVSNITPIRGLYAIQLQKYEDSKEISPFGFKIFDGLKKLGLED